jgi:hypothetical protein
MSPTYLAVQMAAAQQQLEHAQEASDIAGMRAALAMMTALIRSYYGSATRVA